MQFKINFLLCLGLIDVLSTNQFAEFFACILIHHKQVLLFCKKCVIHDTFHEKRHEMILIGNQQDITTSEVAFEVRST